MKTKYHSRQLRKTKRKQKKRETTKKRGGVNIIGNEDSPPIPINQNDVSPLHIIDNTNDGEDLVEDDPNFSPEIQDIADDSITFYTQQKQHITSFCNQLITIRSIYLRLHPHWSGMTTDFYFPYPDEETAEVLLDSVERNATKLKRLFTDIIRRNHLNAARRNYAYLVSHVRPHVIQCMEKTDYYHNIGSQFFSETSNLRQITSVRHLRYELADICTDQDRYGRLAQQFIAHQCVALANFCNL